jgi:hypothetical protein
MALGFQKFARASPHFPDLVVFGEKGVRPEDKQKFGEDFHLRKYCCVKYYYETTDNGITQKHFESGFLRAELVPDSGQWRVLLITSEEVEGKLEGHFCGDCSNQNQCVKRCQKDKCPIAIAKVTYHLAPNPSRLTN